MNKPNSFILLRPNETHSYAAIISKRNVQSSLCHIGYPEIEWSVGMGENGIMRGRDLVTADKYANKISIDCLKRPATVTLGELFQISIRVTNHTNSTVLAILQCGGSSPPIGTNTSPFMSPLKSNKPISSSSTTNGSSDYSDSSLGLYVVGLSTFDIGRLAEEECFETILNVFAVQPGIQKLAGFSITDRISGHIYPVETDICNVFVRNENEDCELFRKDLT
jgi:hypothetical protein